MNTDTGFLGSVLNWFAHPFNSQGSAVQWFLFLGLLIVIVGLWQLILLEVTKEL